MTLTPGTRIGPYEVVSIVGAGGMGEVYRARDPKLQRDVALKILPEIFASDPDRLTRFDREARTLAALNHSHIAGIYGFEESNSVRALALEFVDGETLADRIARGPIPIDETLTIARQVSEALEAAHEQGIIHRDLKPANIKITAAGQVKVLDFGLAKALHSTTEHSTDVPTITSAATKLGSILGTPAYMAPEQAKGKPVDKRSDIWAFGCVLFEMLTGHPAFEGETASEVVANVLTGQPDWNRLRGGTPAPLTDLIRRCLEKDARQRLRDMGDARLELEELERRPIATVAPSVLARTLPTRRGLLAATAVLLAVAVGFGVWWRSSTSQEATAARARAGGARILSRVTFDAGLQTHAEWSPDGQALAFASDRGGQFDIWVQRLGGGDALQLTRSPAADVEPAWAPDGHSIVFRSEREGGGLFIVPAVGGTERRLTSFGVKPQWTPDGTEILFRSSRITTTSLAGFDETSGLYAIPAVGGEAPRQVLQSFLSGGRWVWIASHPDGRISALGQHTTLGWGFFTVARDGRHMTQSELAADLPLRLGNSQMAGAGTRVMRFHWNALGTALYVEAIINEVQSIWRVDVEPKTLRWMSAERLTTGSGADANVAVSHDGNRLAFTTEHRTSRLWVFPFDASTGTIGDHGRPVTPEETLVTWSDLASDGSKIAYLTRRAGSQQVDLWGVNVDGSQRELLASQDAAGGSWAPNAQAIAYPLFRVESGEGALAMRAVGGTERLLSPWGRDSFFVPSDWTRDGAMLLGSYSSPTSAPAALALWPAAKLASKPFRVVLAVSNASLWQARFSPDMHWIVCVVQRHGSSQGVELIVFRAADGRTGELLRIAADHVWADKPKWAPDGRALYFLSRQHSADVFDLWGVTFDPTSGAVGTPFRVSHFDSPSQMISPDLANTDIGIAERWALLTIETVTGNVWMLDHVD